MNSFTSASSFGVPARSAQPMLSPSVSASSGRGFRRLCIDAHTFAFHSSTTVSGNHARADHVHQVLVLERFGHGDDLRLRLAGGAQAQR